jgi:hypothetical protein
MRKLLIVAGFAAMIASPASAQSYSPGYGTGNIVSLPAATHGGFSAAGTPNGAYAYAPENATPRSMRNVRAQELSPNDPDTVYEGGQYVGRDPDPNVRLQLRRDWTHD